MACHAMLIDEMPISTMPNMKMHLTGNLYHASMPTAVTGEGEARGRREEKKMVDGMAMLTTRVLSAAAAVP